MRLMGPHMEDCPGMSGYEETRLPTVAEMTGSEPNMAPTVGQQIRRLESQVNQLRKALERVASLGGNLPDDRLTSRTGGNDAAARGLMYVNARFIATTALFAVSNGEDMIEMERRTR
jgi:hypothetical protein